MTIDLCLYVSSTGQFHIEMMKCLAIKGNGLNSYIAKYAKFDYAYKTQDVREEDDKSKDDNRKENKNDYWLH